jgi:DNA primase
MTKEDIEKVRLVRILKVLGMPESGRRTSVRCPFHNEKTPSLVIYPDNSFHCYGCGAHGKGAIDFVMKLGCTFKDAVEELKPYL